MPEIVVGVSAYAPTLQARLVREHAGARLPSSLAQPLAPRVHAIDVQHGYIVLEDPGTGGNLAQVLHHKSHMAYRTGNVCPPTHPAPRPHFKLRYASVGTPNMRLASGPAYTMNGDFFNTGSRATQVSRMRAAPA